MTESPAVGNIVEKAWRLKEKALKSQAKHDAWQAVHKIQDEIRGHGYALEELGEATEMARTYNGVEGNVIVQSAHDRRNQINQELAELNTKLKAATAELAKLRRETGGHRLRCRIGYHDRFTRDTSCGLCGHHKTVR